MNLAVVRGLSVLMILTWGLFATRVSYIFSKGWGELKRGKPFHLMPALLTGLFCASSFIYVGTLKLLDPEKYIIGQQFDMSVSFGSGSASAYWCVQDHATRMCIKYLPESQERQHKIRLLRLSFASAVLWGAVVPVAMTTPEMTAHYKMLIFFHYFGAAFSLSIIWRAVNPLITKLGKSFNNQLKAIDQAEEIASKNELEKWHQAKKRIKRRTGLVNILSREFKNNIFINMLTLVIFSAIPFFRLRITYQLFFVWSTLGVVLLFVWCPFYDINPKKHAKKKKSTLHEDLDRKKTQMIKNLQMEGKMKMLQLPDRNRKRTERELKLLYCFAGIEVLDQIIAVANYIAFARNSTLASIYGVLYTASSILVIALACVLLQNGHIFVKAMKKEIKYGIPIHAARFRRTNTIDVDSGELLEYELLSHKRKMARSVHLILSGLTEDSVVLCFSLYRLIFTKSVLTQEFLECSQNASSPGHCMDFAISVLLFQVLLSTGTLIAKLSYIRDYLSHKSRIRLISKALDSKTERLKSLLDDFSGLSTAQVEAAVKLKQTIRFHACPPTQFIATELHAHRVYLRVGRENTLSALNHLDLWLQFRKAQNVDQIRRQILLGDLKFSEIPGAEEWCRIFGWTEDATIHGNCLVQTGCLDLAAITKANAATLVETALFVVEWLLVLIDGLSQENTTAFELRFEWWPANHDSEFTPGTSSDLKLGSLFKAWEDIRACWDTVPIKFHHAICLHSDSSELEHTALELTFGHGGSTPVSHSKTRHSLTGMGPHQTAEREWQMMSDLLDSRASELSFHPDVKPSDLNCVIGITGFLDECEARAKQHKMDGTFQVYKVTLEVDLQVALVDFSDERGNNTISKLRTELRLATLVEENVSWSDFSNISADQAVLDLYLTVRDVFSTAEEISIRALTAFHEQERGNHQGRRRSSIFLLPRTSSKIVPSETEDSSASIFYRARATTLAKAGSLNRMSTFKWQPSLADTSILEQPRNQRTKK